MPRVQHLALPLALGILAGPAAAATTNGSYKGRTEQDRAVTFTLRKNKVHEFQAGVLTHCNTMYDNRFNTDAIANLPDISIKGGRFDYKDEDVEVHGRLKGRRATGTVSLSRADSTYYGGQTWFGTCSAYDLKFTARRR